MDSKAHLSSIIHIAEVLQRKTRSCAEQYFGPSIDILGIPDFEPLILDIPSSSQLVPELLEAGIPDRVAEVISAKYHATAKELADYQCNTVYADTVQKLRFQPSFDHTKFITLFQEAHRRTYLSSLSKWKEKIFATVERRFGQTVGTEERDAKSFDQNFVPFLEKCFEKNSRPSRGDKELLAEKTGMSYRQIHVWFQNRRSRTKRVLPTSNAQSEELNSCSRASSVTLVDGNPLLSYAAPPHAFPAVYPPEIEVDPFPCRFGDFTSLPKPCWLRSPCMKHRSSSEPDVSALISAFEKLRLNDSSGSKTTRKGRSASGTARTVPKFYYEAIRPTVVRPLRAPLVSIVKSATTRLSSSSCAPSQESDLQRPNEGTAQDGTRPKTKSRKLRQSKASVRTRNAPEGDQRLLPAAQPTHECSTDTSAAPTKSKSRRKTTRSIPAARRGRKTCAEPELTAEATRESEEESSSHPSPTVSIDSLPSLSYSTASSSSSTCSLSPTSSFATLSDGVLASSAFDEYQSNCSLLTLPPSLTTQLDDQPPPAASFTSEGFTFDLLQGPLDYSFGFDLSAYPSYFNSFDSLSQGLGASSDFLCSSSLELPCLAS